MLKIFQKQAKVVHILGAGLAGLSAAREIRRCSPQSRIIIYEAKERAGGRAFSYYNKTLEKEVDNATHVVLGCNREVRSLLQVCEFEKKLRFWDGFNKRAYKQWWKCKEAILASIFNTPAKDVAYPMLWKVFWKLFPFMRGRLIYYSHDNLRENLIEPLLPFANEIRYGQKLKKIETNGENISALIFDKGRVEVKPGEFVLSALDAQAYEQIFDGPSFEFEKIITIAFRTSQPLYLPGNVRYLGVVNSLAQWVFKNYDIISVTISVANGLHIDDEELKREIWSVLSGMRGLTPAFMPPCQLFHHEKATIKQDARNNALRPRKAATAYKNLFLAGDWTLKDYPCCMESAVISGKRAAKAIMRVENQ